MKPSVRVRTSWPPAKPGGCWPLGPEHARQEIWFRADLLKITRQALKFHRKRRLWSEFGQAAGVRKRRASSGNPAGQAAGMSADTGWVRCACKPGSVFERRCRFGMGAGLSSWKCAEKRTLKRAFLKGILKNCHSGLMRELALRPKFAKNWILPPTKQFRVRLEETSRSLLECRKDAMQESCGGGRLGLSRQRSRSR